MVKKKQEEKPVLKVVDEKREEETLKAPSKGLPPRKQPVMNFDAWWTLIQRKMNLSSHMKEAIFKHFKVRGFLASKQYDEGLKDFGFKL